MSPKKISFCLSVLAECFWCLPACLAVAPTTAIVMFRSWEVITSSSHWILSFFCSEHELFMFSFSVWAIHCEGGYFGILPPHPRARHLLPANFATQQLGSWKYWRNGVCPRFTHVPELFTDRPYFIGMSTWISWANDDDDISCSGGGRCSAVLPRNCFLNEFFCFISHENWGSWKFCTCGLNLWVILSKPSFWFGVLW